MRPVRSAICFTVACGAGCGLLVLIGVFASGRTIPSDRWVGLAAMGTALGAIGIALVSSAYDPGRPERLLHTLSRWLSSWHYRAFILATAAYVPAGLFCVGWLGYGEVDGMWRVGGLAAALLAGFAVHATAMDYATLHEVPAWSNRWTVPLYLALAVYTGALWLHALLAPFGRANPDAALIVVVTLFLSFYLKRRYWRFIDVVRAISTAETSNEPSSADERRAHIEAARETGDSIARERALTLRRYAFVLLFVVPLVLTMVAMEATHLPAALAVAGAALSGTAGVVIERRLFFAEAA